MLLQCHSSSFMVVIVVFLLLAKFRQNFAKFQPEKYNFGLSIQKDFSWEKMAQIRQILN